MAASPRVLARPHRRVATAATAASRTCAIDARGDLRLTTAEHTDCDQMFPARDFLVCSRTVARHSEVFDQLLYREDGSTTRDAPRADSGGSGGTADPSWVVNLRDDPSGPLRVLLLIMHGQHSPSRQISTSLAEIYNLVVVAEKYACLKLLQPWASNWAAGLDARNATSPRDLCRAAWLSYNLGEERVYADVVKCLVVDYLAGDEELQQAMASTKLPEGLEARIEEDRLGHMSVVLGMIQDCLEDLAAPPSGPSSHCRAAASPPGGSIEPGETMVCHARLLGTMIQTLHSYGMWPLPSVYELSEYSLKDLEDLVAALTTPPAAGDMQAVLKSAHVSCAINFQAPEGEGPAPALALEYTYTLSEVERSYLAAQALLFGLNTNKNNARHPRPSDGGNMASLPLRSRNSLF